MFLNDLFSLEGKCAVVTGASGYLGRYMSKALFSAGADVILLGRSKKMIKMAEDLNSLSSKNNAVCYTVDFYEREKLESTLNEISDNYNVSILVNNAFDFSQKTGFNTQSGTIEEITYDVCCASFESGLFWPLLTTQVFGMKMKENNSGSIINISSMYGIVSPNPKLYEGVDFFNPPTYSMVKSGILGLTRYTASFYAKYNIRCNAIAPGPFSNTEDNTCNSVNEENPFLDKVRGNTLFERIGHPNDLCGALIFLSSDASRYMTGQTMIIDGGWTVT